MKEKLFAIFLELSCLLKTFFLFTIRFSATPDFGSTGSCPGLGPPLVTSQYSIRRSAVKLRSYDLSFHEFRPRFALFPIVRTGRIDVARGLVSASDVSRVMAVNSSHIKGRGSGQTASVHPFTRELPRYLP
ncbi:hypothetical protein AVEN_125084-1 [Araneus ventricosus]|uniref:Uncharacterized protein n=1 Tax=Araneus ventricosus TaxID=182803 RepID=A0A4Y2TKX1_ARAVE|nr:hypothetical protein AVEN_125084-1 [Araneus ventricosus]